VLRITPEKAREKANDYLDKLLDQIKPENKQDPQAPIVKQALGSFRFQEPTSTAQIEALRKKIDDVFENISPTAENFYNVENRVQEVFYFVPMLLAQYLERSGEYLAALDWYKAVYAYTLPANRKIYKGLTLKESDADEFAKTPDWLLEDFNPHKVAQTRGNVYTRYTIRSLVQCLLAFADDQFSRETAESIPQARALYLEALDLLNLPEMKVFAQFKGKNLENSLLQSLRNHASMNLLKLRNGLNIAGLERPQRSSSGIRMVTRQPTADSLPLSGPDRTGEATDRDRRPDRSQLSSRAGKRRCRAIRLWQGQTRFRAEQGTSAAPESARHRGSRWRATGKNAAGPHADQSALLRKTDRRRLEFL
jgi:hypothetical protein